jgi:hypothetical protein
MKRVVFRYRFKADCAAENEVLVPGLFDELARMTPGNVRYCSLKLGDGVSSVHIMEAAEGHPLADLSALSRRLWRKPATGASSTPIGAYRLFEV